MTDPDLPQPDALPLDLPPADPTQVDPPLAGQEPPAAEESPIAEESPVAPRSAADGSHVDDLGQGPLSTDAQRGQRGPASEQTGAEQTGVDDTGREVPDVVGVGSGAAPDDIPDPQEWATGDDPMTSSQRSFLDSLARQAGEQLPGNLTKAQASEHIDRLQRLLDR